MRGLLRRALGRAGPAAGAVPAAFDALLTIDPAALPPGVDGAAAAAAVRDAVQAMPGAGWISTACHPGRARAAPVEAELFAPGSSAAATGEGWRTLRDGVAAVAQAAIARMPPTPPAGDGWTPAAHQRGAGSDPTPPEDEWGLLPEPAAAGFAEAPGLDLLQMEALRQLIRPAWLSDSCWIPMSLLT